MGTAVNYLENFPNKPVRIEGQPSYASLAKLHEDLRHNAASIQTSLWGGQNGHLALVVNAAKWATLAPGVPQQAPVRPDDVPNIEGVAAAARDAIKNRHAADQRNYNTYMEVHQALKTQIISCIEPSYLDALMDPDDGLRRRSAIEILTFLFTEHGEITSADKATNDEKMRAAWNPSTPFSTLVTQIQDGMQFAAAGGLVMADQQVVDIAHNIVYKTGLFFTDCNTWDVRPANQRTWADFKTFFHRAHKQLKRQQETSQAAGYHSANAATQEINSRMEVVEETMNNIAHTGGNTVEILMALMNDMKEMKLQMEKTTQASKAPGKERREPKRRKDHNNYCWTHGYLVAKEHTSEKCNNPAEGHKTAANRQNTMGGSTQGKAAVGL